MSIETQTHACACAAQSEETVAWHEANDYVCVDGMSKRAGSKVKGQVPGCNRNQKKKGAVMEVHPACASPSLHCDRFNTGGMVIFWNCVSPIPHRWFLMTSSPPAAAKIEFLFKHKSQRVSRNFRISPNSLKPLNYCFTFNVRSRGNIKIENAR